MPTLNKGTSTEPESEEPRGLGINFTCEIIRTASNYIDPVWEAQYEIQRQLEEVEHQKREQEIMSKYNKNSVIIIEESKPKGSEIGKAIDVFKENRIQNAYAFAQKQSYDFYILTRNGLIGPDEVIDPKYYVGQMKTLQDVVELEHKLMFNDYTNNVKKIMYMKVYLIISNYYYGAIQKFLSENERGNIFIIHSRNYLQMNKVIKKLKDQDKGADHSEYFNVMNTLFRGWNIQDLLGLM